MKNKKALISIIVPVFNECESVDPFVASIGSVFAGLDDYEYEIVFINDGSRDSTLKILLTAQKNNRHIVIIDLSRNFGKEAALSAGLDFARGAAAIPMDVDLQDPPSLIPALLAKWREGYDVVLARRVNRDGDSWLKRTSAGAFYKLNNYLSDTPLPENVGDFRLMDRKVLDAFKRLPERSRFLKGIFAWLGFPSAVVDYARPARQSGKTSYNYWKLFKLSLDAITGFSVAPLRIWTLIGGLIALGSLIYALIIFIRTLLYGIDVPGYASLLVAITFLGGAQLMGIGFLGEYLGRTYLESKGRPVYLINRIYGDGKSAGSGEKDSGASP